MEIENFVLDPKGLADLLIRDEGIVSGKIAKEIFSGMVTTKKPAKETIDEKGLIQLKDKAETEKLAEEVLRENPEQVQECLSGEEKLFGFFVGEVMKKGKGKANLKLVNAILKEKLRDEEDKLSGLSLGWRD